MVGIESEETTVATSSTHFCSSEKISILASDGSSGNSTILRPRGVRAPALVSAPRNHSEYIELSRFSCGGGSMKSKVGPLDLRHRHRKQLPFVSLLRVQAVAAAGPGPSRAACTLVGTRLGHGEDGEGIHAHPRVVDLELAVAGIDDVQDAIDGQGSLRDIRRYDDLAGAALGLIEDLGLQLRGQQRVDR
eukprot:scaffold66445_cov50-Phaeocystis_antarctica.AAC.2